MTRDRASALKGKADGVVVSDHAVIMFHNTNNETFMYRYETLMKHLKETLTNRWGA